ncbi:MAG: EAL domain-containing protein [Maricaulaceae bacterium]
MMNTPQSNPFPKVGQHGSTLELLDSMAFELTLGKNILWANPQVAHMNLGEQLPKTLLQLDGHFDAITPRFSINNLPNYLPGSQSRWSFSRENYAGETQYFELRLERTEEPDHFIGALQDVTVTVQKQLAPSDHVSKSVALGGLDLAVFTARRDLLATMAAHYCPHATHISFKLHDAEQMDALYGPLTLEHIERELLRRLTAFLPDGTSVCLDDGRLMLLLPDIQTLDAESLSQALTAFPISTPEGAVNIALDIDTQMLLPPTKLNPKPAEQVLKRQMTQELTAEDILTLLNQRRLSLALQPICDAKTGKIHHYEALMRVDDPDKGPISAWRHILAAEKLDLVHLMDMRALERATLLMLRYPDIHIALNVSAATICNDVYQAEYFDLLDAHPNLHHRITCEMTETMALDNLDMVAAFSSELGLRGCALSIDDFGAGHTTFKTLMTTEAAQIKLDGSLISNICRSQEQQNFVRLMVDFADTFDVKLVVERVETRKEQMLLSALGVDYLQGYYLGKPISEHDFNQHPKRGGVSS